MSQAESSVTVASLQRMKRDHQKIVGVVAWDYQIAKIVDQAGVDMISVGDTAGVNLLGHSHPLQITMGEMMMISKAVRRGVRKALVSCDLPFGPLQKGVDSAVRAAVQFAKAGMDMIKLDGAADFPDTVRAIVRCGIPVFAQFGITPQTALQHGISYSDAAKPEARIPSSLTEKFVDDARRLEDAGAALLDFTNSGPVVGPEVVSAVSIPVLGGFGGGPWLDGRIRMAHAAIGYAASNVDSHAENYANVAKIAFEAINNYANDVRSGRQIKSGAPTV
jgi:3-methyl-2-oxobutanoate hydroxymethyltransferase